MLGDMGYTDKLQKLCALRGLDQSELANRVSLSKSSISRILSGAQEPKLRLAYDLANALGVTLDYLVGDSPELGPTDRLVMVTEEELTILKIVRHLGPSVSKDRLLILSSGTNQTSSDAKAVAAPPGVRLPSEGSSRGGSV
jgi:transcriptional regulator with XRE-family HTH domain